MVNGPRGFALVDAVVGGILLSLVLMTTISMVGRSVSEQRRGERTADASRLADETLELLAGVGPDRFPDVVGMRGVYEEPFDGYEYEVELDTLGGREGLYLARVEVFWEGAGETDRSVIVETLVSVARGEFVEGERQPASTVQRGSVEE